MSLTIDTSDCFTVNAPPRVRFPGFIVLRDANGQLGSIDAEFDFSNVPPQWHPLMLQVLQGSPSEVHCGGVYDCKITEPPRPGFWARIRARWTRRERADSHVVPAEV